MTLHKEPTARRDDGELRSPPLTRELYPWRATGREHPVFLDERGRRALLVRALGALGLLASGLTLTLLVTGALIFVHVAPSHRATGHRVPATHLVVRVHPKLRRTSL